MPISPTEKSLALLRKNGWTPAIVEHWQSFGGKGGYRKDLWGFGDILAVHPTRKETLIVQCTSATNVSHRVRKIQGIPAARDWLRAGNKIQIHGWKDKNVRIVDMVDTKSMVVTERKKPRIKRTKQPELFE